MALIELARAWPPHRKPQGSGLFFPPHYLPPPRLVDPGPSQTICALINTSEWEGDAAFQGIKADMLLKEFLNQEGG